jgi:transcriptional regulator with XRE-family HTH domain
LLYSKILRKNGIMTTSTIQEFTQAETTASPASGKRELSLAQRMALGSRLTELREDAGYTQLQVARLALGFTVSHAAVSRLERGVFGVVDNVKLDQLAAFYHTSVEALMVEMEGRQEGVESEEFSPADCLVVAPGVHRRLFHLRQAERLTKAQMAVKLGYAVGSVSTVITPWERGEATPRPDTLLDIAIAFGVSAAWLITGKRAKPAKPTLPMRLRAMQKIYNLANRDVALLANLDLEGGPKLIHRMSRGKDATPGNVAAVAQALDVPVTWICPPEEGFSTAPASQNSVVLDCTSPKAAQFLEELADLFSASVLKDHDIGKLRQRFLHELMSAQKPPSNRRFNGSMRTA